MIWILTIASLIGVVANIYKKQWCFIIWAFTNFSWMVIDFINGLPEQSVLFALYFILAIWGLIQWKKPKEKTYTAKEVLRMMQDD